MLLPGGLLIDQGDNVFGLELISSDQYLANAIGVVHGIVEFRPMPIAVDPDNHCPAFPIEFGDGDRRRRRWNLGGRLVQKSFTIPTEKAVAIVLQGLENEGQRIHGALVNVVKQDDTALLFRYLPDNPVCDRFRNRVRPVSGVDIPQDRFQMVSFQCGDRLFVPGPVGRPKKGLWAYL